MGANFDLFEGVSAAAIPPSSLPPGFRYTRDIITPAEEAMLASEIARLELQPFEFHGYLGLRRIHAFGYRYDYQSGTVANAEPIPDFLQSLRHKVADFAGRSADEFRQVLATEYAPGAPIGWHRDKPQFGIVAGVSLISP